MRALTLLVLLAVTAAEARAQICRGYPSPAKKPISLGAGAAVTGEWHGAGATFGLGHSSGLFATFGFGFDRSDLLKDKYVVLAGGFEKLIGQSRKMSICPVASAGHLFGPNHEFLDGDLKSSSNTVAGGVSFGTAFAIDDAINLLPYARVEASYASERRIFDGSASTLRQTYELLTIGAGFSIIERYTIQPWFSFPFGLKDADMGAGLAVRVSFSR